MLLTTKPNGGSLVSRNRMEVLVAILNCIIADALKARLDAVAAEHRRTIKAEVELALEAYFATITKQADDEAA